jgi:acyl dehydratase
MYSGMRTAPLPVSNASPSSNGMTTSDGWRTLGLRKKLWAPVPWRKTGGKAVGEGTSSTRRLAEMEPFDGELTSNGGGGEEKACIVGGGAFHSRRRRFLNGCERIRHSRFSLHCRPAPRARADRAPHECVASTLFFTAQRERFAGTRQTESFVPIPFTDKLAPSMNADLPKQASCLGASARPLLLYPVVVAPCLAWLFQLWWTRALSLPSMLLLASSALLTPLLGVLVATNTWSAALPYECVFEDVVEVPFLTKLLWVLYRRRRGLRPGQLLPELSVTLTGYKVRLCDVEDYADACQVDQAASAALPPLFLEAVARPLGVFLGTHPGMPLNLLGCVHTRTSVRSCGGRTARPGESLVAKCRLSPRCRSHRRGLEFDLVTTFHSAGGGQLLYESTMTLLCFVEPWRDASAVAASTASPANFGFMEASFDRGSVAADRPLDLLADASNGFASLTGDYNPIHVSHLAARLFGQKGKMMYGMCVAGTMVKLATNAAPFGPVGHEKPWRFDVAFKSPVYIPGKVHISLLRREAVGSGEEPCYYMEARPAPSVTGGALRETPAPTNTSKAHIVAQLRTGMPGTISLLG